MEKFQGMNEFYKIAVSNISKRGDTDIFPFPIENALFYDKPAEIENILLEMDKNYDSLIRTAAVGSIKTSIPVGYTGFRWATMIDPIWNAFLLAEVLKISGQIEQKRIPVEENCVFSYRIKYDEESGTLFNREVNWKAFYQNAGKIAADYKFIITFDIADFYNRIYHERLREVLTTDIGADGKAVDRIMGIVSRIANGNETSGLPIGGNASRILAEALLTRADSFMKENGMKFCRFVDDYIVFADSKSAAYNILNRCADYFQRSLGLSLQKNKTAIMSLFEFRRHVKMVFDEIGGDKDADRTSIMKLNINLDPYSATADEALRDIKDHVDSYGIIRLLKSECRKTKINQMFGKQLVRVIQFMDEQDISEAFEVLSVNFEKLYPVFPVIMRTAYRNLLKCNDEGIQNFISKVSEMVDANSYLIQTGNNASYAIRVLSLVQSKLAEQTIRKIYERSLPEAKDPSELIRMNAIYAMTNLGNSAWILDRLNEFPHLSSWERRAVIASAALLGNEGNKWNESVRNTFSPLEKLLADWAAEKLAEKPNWRLPL